MLLVSRKCGRLNRRGIKHKCNNNFRRVPAQLRYNSLLGNSIFDQLNKEQKIIVDYPKSQCLIAGPGTGKSHCIAAKAAKLVEMNVNPDKILIITSSKRSSKRIQNVLDENTPMLKAPKVHSYQTFAQEITAGTVSKVDDQYLLSSVAEKLFFEDCYDKLGLNIFEEEKDKHTPLEYVKNRILNYFHALQTYKIVPSDYRKYIDGIKAEIKRSKERLKSLDVSHRLKYVDQHEVLLHGFIKYKELRAEAKKYNFLDMISLAIELVDSLNTFEYEYLFVDDIQNIIPLEYHLLKALSNRIPKDNLLISGDDDQAICAWKGSKMAVFDAVFEDFPDLNISTLTTNYRSSPSILKASRNVITNNKNRIELKFGLSKNMIPASKEKGKVKTMKFATKDKEFDGIIELVAKDLSKNQDASIAVLFKNNADVNDFLKECEKSNISKYIDVTRKLSETPIMELLLSWLISITNPSQNKYFYKILISDIYKFPSKYLTGLYENTFDTETTLFDVFEQFSEKQSEDAKESVAILKARDIIFHYEKYSKLVLQNTKSLVEVLSVIISENSYFQKFIKPDTEDDQHQGDLIKELFKFVHSEELKIPDNPIKLINNIQQRLENDEIFQIEGDHGIFVGTIWTANYSEFDTVILASCTKENYPGRYWDTSIQLPGTLTDENRLDITTHKEESRRVIYTAMTRAKSNFIFTSHKQDDILEKQYTPSPYISEIVGISEKFPEKMKQPIQDDVAKTLFIKNLHSNQKLYIESERSSTFKSINIVQAYTYIKCEIQHAFKNILSHPGKDHMSMENQLAIRKAFIAIGEHSADALDTQEYLNDYYKDYQKLGSTFSAYVSEGMKVIEQLINAENDFPTDKQINLKLSTTLHANNKSIKLNDHYHRIHTYPNGSKVLRYFLVYEATAPKLALIREIVNLLILAYNNQYDDSLTAVVLYYIRSKQLRELVVDVSKHVDSSKSIERLVEICGKTEYNGPTNKAECRTCPFTSVCPHKHV
eukprot:TRINITY_DN5711_c0_g1_i2.p1 TRINITY_DN5711_c0_g1~~TRINITY_DN5711_c0_g1_i2.p1  ORF type:complete len:998 (-),score=196.96 TRINITY_DN5711_c0_g1_i2:1055-4048(-)